MPRTRRVPLAVLRFLMAAEEGRLDVVRRSLDNGIDPNIVGHRGLRALHRACRTPRLALVNLLIEAGADPNAANDQGQTPLHTLAHHAQTLGDVQGLDVIERLVSVGATVDARDKHGMTPLMKALHHSAVVERLLTAGANPNAHAGPPKRWASVINLLLETTKNPFSSSSLPAGTSDQEASLRHLLNHGADSNALDGHRRLPLMQAVRQNVAPSFVQLLVEHGADPFNPADRSGITPMAYAHAHAPVLGRLIEVLHERIALRAMALPVVPTFPRPRL